MLKIFVITLFLPALLAREHIAPYPVAIMYKRRTIHCGGSIITPSIVLTAASCQMPNLQDFRVMAGARSYSAYDSSWQTRRIAEFVPHESYEFPLHDIALVHLKSPFRLYFFLNKIELSRSAAHPTGSAIATDWELIKVANTSSVPLNLRMVTLSLISRADCLDEWGYLPADVTCAAASDEDTHTRSNSGDPLVHKVNGVPVQIGIASYRAKCASLPAVYTTVAMYATWITEHSRTIDE